MTDVEIFTKPDCGWAERNYAALFEKRVPFRTVISRDKDGKPTGDFLSISPYRKTPALRIGSDVVWESAIINEYIDDRYPDPPLRPRDAKGRAQARLWTHHCDFVLIPALSQLGRSECRQDAADTLARNQELLSLWWQARVEIGAFWRGGTISLVDIAFHTFFQAWDVVAEVSGRFLAPLDPGLREWKEQVANWPSIEKAGETGRAVA